MYDPRPGYECGVLMDYDLAIFKSTARPSGDTRTGTVPFMATQLLRKAYWEGQIQRLYKHELEACIWVLAFVFLRYNDRQIVPDTQVEGWMIPDYDVCCNRKSGFILHLTPNEFKVQPSFKDQSSLAFRLLLWLRRQIISALDNVINNVISDPDEEETRVWQDFKEEIRLAIAQAGGRYDYLNVLIST